MKARRIEKQGDRDVMSRPPLHSRATARRRARTSQRAVADRQIAEIERTFTLRYEW